MALRPLYVPKSNRGPAEHTPGKEFMDVAGKEYIGLYHTYKNGDIYSEGSYNKSSFKLQPIELLFTDGPKQNGKYFDLTAKMFNKHTVPIYYYPQPTKADYASAQFRRYFVAKKNQYNTIIEIDDKQAKKMNVVNKRGLNEDLYAKLSLVWTIRGPLESVIRANKDSISAASDIIPTIKGYLGDLLEYYKG